MIMIDIEMPSYCYDCPCHNGENGRCQISGNFIADERPFDCPLIAVDKIPATYAEEVKHGEWRCGFDIRCSCCGYKLEATGFPSECPACHAKMDGGKIDEDILL